MSPPVEDSAAEELLALVGESALGRDPLAELAAPDPFVARLDELTLRSVPAPPTRRPQPLRPAAPPRERARRSESFAPEAPTRLPRRRWASTPPLGEVEPPAVQGFFDRLLSDRDRRVLAALAQLVEGEAPYDRYGFSPDVTRLAFLSKGACLLRVMHDAFAGVSVDVSDFKANLLSDLFYKCPLGGDRVLFASGPIDDLSYVEETPDAASFAQYLSVFYGTSDNLLGLFDFASAGEKLPDLAASAEHACSKLGVKAFPTHTEARALGEKDQDRYAEIHNALSQWTERERIAWMEATAKPGKPGQPTYRYYLTRNRSLLAVRDAGEDGKRLFALRVAERARPPVPHRDNPFSGVH